jgi:hypothetical protein
MFSGKYDVIRFWFKAIERRSSACGTRIGCKHCRQDNSGIKPARTLPRQSKLPGCAPVLPQFDDPLPKKISRVVTTEVTSIADPPGSGGKGLLGGGGVGWSGGGGGKLLIPKLNGSSIDEPAGKRGIMSVGICCWPTTGANGVPLKSMGGCPGKGGVGAIVNSGAKVASLGMP